MDAHSGPVTFEEPRFYWGKWLPGRIGSSPHLDYQDCPAMDNIQVVQCLNTWSGVSTRANGRMRYWQKFESLVGILFRSHRLKALFLLARTILAQVCALAFIYT